MVGWEDQHPLAMVWTSPKKRSPRSFLLTWRLIISLEYWFDIHGSQIEIFRCTPFFFEFLDFYLMTKWTTWRIIPATKWLITMVSKSPNWGCSPNFLTGIILQVDINHDAFFWSPFLFLPQGLLGVGCVEEFQETPAWSLTVRPWKVPFPIGK